MVFKELSLEDKDTITAFLMDTPNRTAIMNFPSLYIWKDWGGGTYWDIINWTLCIKKVFHNAVFMLLPISTNEEDIIATVNKLIEMAKQSGEHLCFREIGPERLEFFDRHWPGAFEEHESVNGANYIYLVSDLISLSGKQYSPKRNHINKLMRSGSKIEIMDINEQLRPQCRSFLDEWVQSHHNNDTTTLQSDYGASATALEHMECLNMKGICLLINDRVEGITLGSRLNRDTVLISVEKANAGIPGAYPYINQQFLERHWQDYTYVNREEDMGNPGLRKAKQSYHPCHMERVFLMRLKNGAGHKA